jgi:hypothetical protein
MKNTLGIHSLKLENLAADLLGLFLEDLETYTSGFSWSVAIFAAKKKNTLTVLVFGVLVGLVGVVMPAEVFEWDELAEGKPLFI